MGKKKRIESLGLKIVSILQIKSNLQRLLSKMAVSSNKWHQFQMEELESCSRNGSEGEIQMQPQRREKHTWQCWPGAGADARSIGGCVKNYNFKLAGLPTLQLSNLHPACCCGCNHAHFPVQICQILFGVYFEKWT